MTSTVRLVAIGCVVAIALGRVRRRRPDLPARCGRASGRAPAPRRGHAGRRAGAGPRREGRRGELLEPVLPAVPGRGPALEAAVKRYDRSSVVRHGLLAQEQFRRVVPRAHVTYPVVAGPRAAKLATERSASAGIPTTVIVDASGRMRFRAVGPASGEGARRGCWTASSRGRYDGPDAGARPRGRAASRRGRASAPAVPPRRGRTRAPPSRTVRAPRTPRA